MTSVAQFDGGGRRGRRPAAGGSFNTQFFNPPKPTYPGPPNINAGGPAPAAPPVTQAPNLGPVGGGNRGGAMPGETPSSPTLTLEDFIKNHILKRQADAEGGRMLEDFDAETLRRKQETEADMAVREQDLDSYLADAGRDAAGGLASRGLERSGLLFQAQDRINEEGVRRRSGIEDLMTNLVGERGRGRQETARNAQQLINERIQQLTGMFNGQNMGQVGI